MMAKKKTQPSAKDKKKDPVARAAPKMKVAKGSKR